MEKNKTGKYFKYAVGEIVLVVIGILIALQINNWNENRRLDKIRQNYYHQLEKDLDSELQNINKQIIRLDKSIDSYKAYKEYTKVSNLQSIEIIQAMEKVDISWGYLSFHSNTFETLESTGDIKLIPSILRLKLIEIKQLQDVMITVATGNDSAYLANMLKAYNLGFMKSIKKSNEDIHQKIEQNYLDIILIADTGFALKNFTEREKINSLKIMLEKANELKALLGQELEK